MEYIRRVNLRYTLYVYLTVAAFGFVETAKSVNFPLIKTDFNLSYSTYGLIGSTTGWTYMLATMLSTSILPITKFKKLIILSFILVSIGSFFVFLFHNLVSILIGLHIMYFGNGVMEVGLNCFISDFFLNNSGLMINLFHGFYGIGCIISPFFAGSVSKTYLKYRLFYLIGSILYLLSTTSGFLLNFDQYYRSPSSKSIDSKVLEENNQKLVMKLDDIDNIMSGDENTKKVVNKDDQFVISNAHNIIIQCAEISDGNISINDKTSSNNNNNTSTNNNINLSLDNRGDYLHLNNNHNNSSQGNNNEMNELNSNIDINTTENTQTTNIYDKLKIFKTLISDPIIILLILALGVQVNVEMSASQWGVLYLEDEFGLDPTTDGALFMTIFYIIFTLSRIVFGRFTDKIGYLNTLFISTIGSTIFFLIGFLTGRVGEYFLMCTGAFVSLFWPSVMCLIIEIYGDEASNATGVVIAIHGLLGSLLGLLQGVINDNIGPSWGYRSSIALSALVFIFLIIISFLKKKRNSINQKFPTTTDILSVPNDNLQNDSNNEDIHMNKEKTKTVVPLSQIDVSTP